MRYSKLYKKKAKVVKALSRDWKSTAQIARECDIFWKATRRVLIILTQTPLVEHRRHANCSYWRYSIDPKHMQKDPYFEEYLEKLESLE